MHKVKSQPTLFPTEYTVSIGNMTHYRRMPHYRLIKKRKEKKKER